MTTREKIIVALSAVAVVAGTFFFITGGGSKAPRDSAGADLKACEDFAGMTVEKLKQANLTKTQAYILERASVNWPSDPFLGRKLPSLKAGATEAAETPFPLAYTGFVIVGQARLAVINGMEYEVGEVVLGSDLVVQTISPQNVIVKRSGGQESINVPFTGEVLREERPGDK